MRIKNLLLFCISITLFGCSEDADISVSPVSLTLNFSHNWEGTEVTNTDFDDLKFVNTNGDTLSIEKLRYLVSEIILTHESGVIDTINNYNLVDVTNGTGFSYKTSEVITPGIYSNIAMRFGFSDENNTDGIYQDLNTASFNVPAILGGGYHYMQMDGEYIDSLGVVSPYNFHAIRAVNTTDPANLEFQDTSFLESFGEVVIGNNTNLNIEMDISEWFTNPNTWDLNEFDIDLMGNFEAQVLMSANGASVFSLGSITQE